MLFGKYKREKDPVKRKQVKRKILLCINLSIGIQMDPYAPIDRPVRTNISLQNMTYMFSKEFLRFRKEVISDLYLLLQFPDKVRLENRSTMSGEEVFMRGLYELECMRRRKKSYALRHFHIWTQLKNKNHTPFFPGRHTTTRQLAYLRHAIFSSELTYFDNLYLKRCRIGGSVLI